MSRSSGTSGWEPPHEGGSLESLGRELAQLIEQVDRVPPEIAYRGRSSLTWRTIDAELAELTESLGTAGVGVRGPASPQRVICAAPRLTFEMEITAVGDRRSLMGLLVPAHEAQIMVRHKGGTAVIRADRRGRFAAENLAAGPCSVRCHLVGDEGGAPIVTDWFPL
jgi:hypothetical protein